jgi:hypothetical protein
MINTDKKVILQKRLDILLLSIGLLSMMSIVVLVGFRLDDASVDQLKYIILLLSLVFIGQEAYRWILFPELKTLKVRWLENLMAVLLLFNII